MPFFSYYKDKKIVWTGQINIVKSFDTIQSHSLVRIILKTQDNNNGTKTMATPIYNIPIGEGGKYTYYTNIAPIYKAPALAPYLWGASPLSVSPLIYGF